MQEHPGKIIVDMDGVIVGPVPEGGSYADCPPNGPMIARLQQLKELGWTIAIYTARNVRSHDYNLGKLTADTVLVAAAYLKKHNVPYDELWPNKPWTGKTGIYVDDRAVRPNEFLNLNSSELLNLARGAAFNPEQPLWRQGNDQDWVLFSFLDGLNSGRIVAKIQAARDKGFRSIIMVDASHKIPVGYDECLARNGARILNGIVGSVSSLQRELTLEGLASAKSRIRWSGVSLPDSGEHVLSSRHFNHVSVDNETVTKTSDTGAGRKKLAFEVLWLEAVHHAAREPLAVGVPTVLTNGYTIPYAQGGSLADALLYSPMAGMDLSQTATDMKRLWAALRSGNHSASKEVTTKDLQDQHHLLYRVKTQSRMFQFGEALPDYLRWEINGQTIGEPMKVVGWLLNQIPVQTLEHRGFWHGDFCPGNIVRLNNPGPSSGHRPDLRLIDPRGSIDGETLCLYGDLRYDMGKLAHALYWGYDAITAGWRDVQWSRSEDKFKVNLRVWDEDASVKPARLHLWDHLCPQIVLADVDLTSPVVHAIAALQLITCAPLHSDDPERQVALVARGLQAAVRAGYQSRKRAFEDEQGT